MAVFDLYWILLSLRNKWTIFRAKFRTLYCFLRNRNFCRHYTLIWWIFVDWDYLFCWFFEEVKNKTHQFDLFERFTIETAGKIKNKGLTFFVYCLFKFLCQTFRKKSTFRKEKCQLSFTQLFISQNRAWIRARNSSENDLQGVGPLAEWGE